MGKDRLLPLFALLILTIGCVSSVYVYAHQTSTETIQVNGQPYTIDELFALSQPRVFKNLNYSGIALDDMIMEIGVTYPDQHTFLIKGADGYEKTVTWENMKNGLLTRNGESVFSDLPKAFRVKDIVSIEVK
jgi:hypothetical protein